ncbi:MAG: hypothetical protein ACTSQF_11055 [Candidatus Heimdallarchaeaceae archaeon]
MNKALIVTLVTFGLLLTGGAIIGIDVYQSFQDYEELSDSFTISDPDFVLSHDNTSADITVEVTTPKLGYIPKSAEVEIVISQSSVEYCDPIVFRLQLGKVEEVEFNIEFNEFDVTKILLGMQLYFQIDITAMPIYMGISIPSLIQYFDFDLTVSSAT